MGVARNMAGMERLPVHVQLYSTALRESLPFFLIVFPTQVYATSLSRYLRAHSHCTQTWRHVFAPPPVDLYYGVCGDPTLVRRIQEVVRHK